MKGGKGRRDVRSLVRRMGDERKREGENYGRAEGVCARMMRINKLMKEKERGEKTKVERNEEN